MQKVWSRLKTNTDKMNLFKILLFIFVSKLCFSQDKNTIVLKTNSLNYLVKTGFNVALEVQTKEKRSYNFSFETGDDKRNFENVNGLKNKFIVFSAEKRRYWYSSKSKPSGLFAAPFLKYRYKDKVQPDDIGSFYLANGGIFKAHFLGIGYLAGYQNHIVKRISIEAKLGLGIQGRVAIKGTTKLTPILPDGLIGLSFGVRL